MATTLLDSLRSAKLCTMGRGVIQSYGISGEGFNPNVTKEVVRGYALALDLKLRRVYYVVNSSLYSMDYTGGGRVKHFSLPQLGHVYGGLSVLSDKVFWTTSYDSIYKGPINLTQPGDVEEITTTSEEVYHMRVVHPSLQSRPKIDPCLDKGCAHSCVATGATTARCSCPPGQALYHDGVSCHSVLDELPFRQNGSYLQRANQSYSTGGCGNDTNHQLDPLDQDQAPAASAGALLLGIPLILNVLLMSLALFLGYKYWSLLKSRPSLQSDTCPPSSTASCKPSLRQDSDQLLLQDLITV